jgi:hypothetical protein
MRKITFLAAALVSAALVWAGGPASTPVQRKAPAKAPATKVAAKQAPSRSSIVKPVSARSTTAKSPVTSARKPGAATSSAQRNSKKPRIAPVTWRNRQTSPSSDRLKQIQDALAAKGYLSPEEATGEWNANSATALKRFQAEQTLEPTGKINSISLIALGLGPKHDLTANRALDGNYPEPEAGHNNNNN